MPSSLHEILVQLFRAQPSLATDFVASRLGRAFPARPRVRLLSGDLAQTVAPQHRADAVLLLESRDRAGKLALVVEVQLGIDPEKLFTWPVYLAGIRARLHCPTLLVVATPYRGVANWAKASIVLGPGGDQIHPLVLGPGAIPAVTDVEAARQNPELALLSALAHARGRKAIPVAVAAHAAAQSLDDTYAKLYVDLILRALEHNARRLKEALMEAGYEYQSKFARKYVAEGEAKGEAKGKAEGKAEGKADAVLAFLSARKLPATKRERQKILACHDLAQLDRWIARAASVTTVADLFR